MTTDHMPPLPSPQERGAFSVVQMHSYARVYAEQQTAKLRAEVERLNAAAENREMVVRLYRAYNSPEPAHRQAAFKDAMLRADLTEQQTKELRALLLEARRGWPPKVSAELAFRIDEALK